VVQPERRGGLDQTPRRRRRVDDEGGRHGAILEDAGSAASHEGVQDGGHTAFPLAGARDLPEQAFDAKDIRLRRIGREPLAQQLARGVDAPRIGALLFRVCARRPAVEHEVRAVVDEDGLEVRRGSRERPDGERIQVQRVGGPFLGAVDVVECGAVDDDMGTQGRHRRSDVAIARDVEVIVGKRADFVGAGEPVHDRSPELAFRADDGDPHLQ